MKGPLFDAMLLVGRTTRSAHLTAANQYLPALHNGFVGQTMAWRAAQSEMIAVRYTDDSVRGFEAHEDAWRFSQGTGKFDLLSST
ncbi:hypothetical protein ALQ58_200402 [Pseudomonas syringae pv. apii]|nr:hypothetical protein ALQ58_200402 [Pseudomonas syringae pv. apii]